MRNPVWVIPSCALTLATMAACGGDDEDDGPPRPDPASIAGLLVTPLDDLENGHVREDTDVAYPSVPPVGGAHDRIWADCNGVVYPRPVRTEHLVHSMEHGAVWIAYDPAKLDAAGIAALSALVRGQVYLVMSPVPGMDSPISVQAWGRQLKVERADDPRIVTFIQVFRSNEETTPELGGTCDVPGRYRELFDRDDPPPFQPVPGPNVVPPDYRGGR